ncbi:MAG: hypothetical protein ACRDI2_21655, partial [Chloroflexota bacterium]
RRLGTAPRPRSRPTTTSRRDGQAAERGRRRNANTRLWPLLDGRPLCGGTSRRFSRFAQPSHLGLERGHNRGRRLAFGF